MARIKSILKEERDINLPEKEVSEIDEQDEKGKLARLVVSKNDLAMASFSIVFTTDTAMNI
jgi:tRNA U34 5-carboxymethylaminomethyl modifying enzyme MnmG/GidA